MQCAVCSVQCVVCSDSLRAAITQLLGWLHKLVTPLKKISVILYHGFSSFPHFICTAGWILGKLSFPNNVKIQYPVKTKTLSSKDKYSEDKYCIQLRQIQYARKTNTTYSEDKYNIQQQQTQYPVIINDNQFRQMQYPITTNHYPL